MMFVKMTWWMCSSVLIAFSDKQSRLCAESLKRDRIKSDDRWSARIIWRAEVKYSWLYDWHKLIKMWMWPLAAGQSSSARRCHGDRVTRAEVRRWTWRMKHVSVTWLCENEPWVTSPPCFDDVFLMGFDVCLLLFCCRLSSHEEDRRGNFLWRHEGSESEGRQILRL